MTKSLFQEDSSCGCSRLLNEPGTSNRAVFPRRLIAFAVASERRPDGLNRSPLHMTRSREHAFSAVRTRSYAILADRRSTANNKECPAEAGQRRKEEESSNKFRLGRGAGQRQLNWRIPIQKKPRNCWTTYPNSSAQHMRRSDYRAKMKIDAAPSTISAPKMSNGVAAQLGLDAGSIIVNGRYSLEKTFANRREPSPRRRGRVAKSRRARRRFLRSIDPSPHVLLKIVPSQPPCGRPACGGASCRMLIQSRQDARQPVECLLKPLVLDLGEITGSVAQHPLIRRDR